MRWEITNEEYQNGNEPGLLEPARSPSNHLCTLAGSRPKQGLAAWQHTTGSEQGGKMAVRAQESTRVADW
jgi:hypothetical protein